jgi:dihydrofolate reductase
MIVSAIFAISENGIIGRDNDIPWRLPADLRRFMKITSGHSVIMGRKTFESMNGPLPRRRNIVLSRNPDYPCNGCELSPDLGSALKMCEGETEVFIIGGAGVYSEAFEKGWVQKIYQTLVHADVEGDTRLDLPDFSDWEVEAVQSNPADDRNEFAFTYIDRVRKSG